jgi:FkbM family methyltransferase
MAVTTDLGVKNFVELRARAMARPVVCVDAARPVWIFGAGGFGRSLAGVMQSSGIKVSGFVETKPQVAQVMDLPVVDWATLGKKDPRAQLALGIFNRNTPYDQLVAISVNSGFDKPLMPWDTYAQFSTGLGWRYWLSSCDALASNLERIGKVVERLADDESRETLYRLCAFRLGLDLPYSSFQCSQNQYFNALTLAHLQGRPISYIDCGAYNGDTYTGLLSQTGIHCRQAFLMEPDPGNYASLVRHVSARYPEAICLPLAAAEKYSILTFSSGQGEGGAIGSGGDIRIAAVALDEILPQAQVDLIKLDVEGAEAQVLKGAARLIERSRPVLTLSLYHNPQDLWELPELLFRMCPDYQFHIRQHYFNSFDCVLYAVPLRR